MARVVINAEDIELPKVKRYRIDSEVPIVRGATHWAHSKRSEGCLGRDYLSRIAAELGVAELLEQAIW